MVFKQVKLTYVVKLHVQIMERKYEWPLSMWDYVHTIQIDCKKSQMALYKVRLRTYDYDKLDCKESLNSFQTSDIKYVWSTLIERKVFFTY